MAAVRIRRFDPATIKPHRVILIVGKRGCGKTTLLRDLMYHLRHSIDFGLAMCPTLESASMLRNALPDASVFDRFVPGKVEQLAALAQQLVASKRDRNFLFIADDVLYDRAVLKGTGIRNIFFNGRHLRITFIILAQYMMDITADLRAQIDYLFVMRENIVANRLRLYKYLFGCVPTFDEFCALMDRCTQNYECLCLDNTCADVRLQNCVFWYKAQADIPDFQIGRAIFQTLADRHRRPERIEVADEPRAPSRRLNVIKEEDPEQSHDER